MSLSVTGERNGEERWRTVRSPRPAAASTADVTSTRDTERYRHASLTISWILEPARGFHVIEERERRGSREFTASERKEARAKLAARIRHGRESSEDRAEETSL